MGTYLNDNGTLKLISGATLWADAPIGAINGFGGSIAPAGWLICNGAAVSREEYAELFAVIGTAYGAGDGSTTFNIPDGREATLKGAGLTGLSNNHIDSDGLTLGEFIDDQLQDHVHSIGVRTSAGGTSGPGWHYLNTPVDATYNSDGVTSSYRKGNTTEVKAIGANWIIKSKQVALPVDLLDHYSNTEKVVGIDADGATIYERSFYEDYDSVHNATFTVSSDIKSTDIKRLKYLGGTFYNNSRWNPFSELYYQEGAAHQCRLMIDSGGLKVQLAQTTIHAYNITIRYVKN